MARFLSLIFIILFYSFQVMAAKCQTHATALLQTEPVVAYYNKRNIPFIVNVTTSIDQPPEPMVEHMMAELKKLKLA